MTELKKNLDMKEKTANLRLNVSCQLNNDLQPKLKIMTKPAWNNKFQKNYLSVADLYTHKVR